MCIAGKASKYTDVDNPDWVPTLHLGYEEEYLDEVGNNVQVETSNEMDDENIQVETSMDHKSWTEIETAVGTPDKMEYESSQLIPADLNLMSLKQLNEYILPLS